MNATHVVVEGTVKPDGSLELESKLNLPPGRVQLIVDRCLTCRKTIRSGR